MSFHDDSVGNTKALVEEVILLTKELARNAIERNELQNKLTQAREEIVELEKLLN